MTLCWSSNMAPAQPEPVIIHTFADAGRFDGFTMHAGDIVGTLKGSRLDEVMSLSLKNVVFVPGELTTNHGVDELPMIAQDTQAAAALKPEHLIAAKVTLARRPYLSFVGLRRYAAPCGQHDRHERARLNLEQHQQHSTGRPK